MFVGVYGVVIAIVTFCVGVCMGVKRANQLIYK